MWLKQWHNCEKRVVRFTRHEIFKLFIFSWKTPNNQCPYCCKICLNPNTRYVNNVFSVVIVQQLFGISSLPFRAIMLGNNDVFGANWTANSDLMMPA